MWIPLESISGAKNQGTSDRKCKLAFDGRAIWIWASTGRIQIMHPSGITMNPL